VAREERPKGNSDVEMIEEGQRPDTEHEFVELVVLLTGSQGVLTRPLRSFQSRPPMFTSRGGRLKAGLNAKYAFFTSKINQK
jgi:hypothetical protein